MNHPNIAPTRMLTYGGSVTQPYGCNSNVAFPDGPVYINSIE